MKKFFNLIYQICLSIGQARAAAALSRSGLHAEAKELLLK
jgi:hypothetical protein